MADTAAQHRGTREPVSEPPDGSASRRVLLVGHGTLADTTGRALEAGGASIRRLSEPSDRDIGEALENEVDTVVVISRSDVVSLRIALVVAHLRPGIPLLVTDLRARRGGAARADGRQRPRALDGRRRRALAGRSVSRSPADVPGRHPVGQRGHRGPRRSARASRPGPSLPRPHSAPAEGHRGACESLRPERAHPRRRADRVPHRARPRDGRGRDHVRPSGRRRDLRHRGRSRSPSARTSRPTRDPRGSSCSRPRACC